MDNLEYSHLYNENKRLQAELSNANEELKQVLANNESLAHALRVERIFCEDAQRKACFFYNKAREILNAWERSLGKISRSL